jgi:hypothetical protein
MLNLRNYKIGTRLIMTTFGALALMIAFVAIALFSLNSIGEKVDHITETISRRLSWSLACACETASVGMFVPL